MIIWFSTRLPLFLWCRSLLYFLYNVAHTTKPRSSPFDLYLYIPFQNTFFSFFFFTLTIVTIFFFVVFNDFFAKYEYFFFWSIRTKYQAWSHSYISSSRCESNWKIWINAHLIIGRFYVKQVLKKIVSSNAVLAKKIAVVMRAKPSARSKLLKLSKFATISDLS